MAVRRKTNPAESVQPGDFGGSCADVEVESADGAEVVLTVYRQHDWSDLLQSMRVSNAYRPGTVNSYNTVGVIL